MKIYGSKARLYSAAIPSAPPMDEEPNGDSSGGFGYWLVERLVARREADETDPWAMLAVHVHEARIPAQPGLRSRNDTFTGSRDASATPRRI
ncbi:hypothetical protein GCM10020255_087800 [Rhodococcus baikonurensis]